MPVIWRMKRNSWMFHILITYQWFSVHLYQECVEKSDSIVLIEESLMLVLLILNDFKNVIQFL